MQIKTLEAIIRWIQQEVTQAGATGVIVGISGGVDSALVGYLAAQAFPHHSLGVLLPINPDRSDDLADGLELVQAIGLRHQVIDLQSEYEQLRAKLAPLAPLVAGNLQARLRMSVLYALAQHHNYLVLGTDNRAEYELGYFTKYGDGGCDLLPISHLFKSEVFAYAQAVGVPATILAKPPSAGLWPGQTDEGELGFSYNDYELFCRNKLTNCTTKARIKQKIAATAHKRVPVPRFASKKD